MQGKMAGSYHQNMYSAPAQMSLCSQNTSLLSKLSLDEDYVMVAAIDFGTTFSGYAFSFKTNKDKIFMNKSWGGNVGFESYKTSTCVMVDSDNTFKDFGYEAEEKYSQQEEEDDFQLYRHFKMMLHGSQKITKHNTIPSIAGQMTSALEIFTMALKYLKNHLIEAVSQQTATGVTASLIRWVITIPAIWNEEAKQFMREAAFKAGIISTKDSRQLFIALEPEKLLRDPAMVGCSYFMLVGGFAESRLLQKAIIDKFRSRVNVLVPEEAQMSVIKGAVLFGHRPDEIEICKARKCYGVQTTKKFDSEIHDEEHKFFAEGVAKCDHIFSMFVKKGDDIKVGETIDNTYGPVYHNQTRVSFKLYESDNPDVKYVVEQGCKRLGKLSVEIPNVEKDLDREVKVEMTFGGTEIQVEAHDVESGGRAETTIDFLFD